MSRGSKRRAVKAQVKAQRVLLTKPRVELLRREHSVGLRPVWAAKGKTPKPGAIKAANLLTWIETNLIIRIKQPEDLDGRKVRLVPFTLNSAQRILAQHLAFCWANRLPIRWWIPKSRQMGISTFVQAVLFTMAIGTEGYHAATVAHTEFAAGEIFKKEQTFEANLADRLKLPMTSCQAAKFEWEHESGTWVGSVKSGDALGRGPTLNAIHFSEVANFADQGRDPEEATSAALGALAEGEDSMVFYESTAKGRDPFYFAGCEKARDPDAGGIDQLIFLPWYLEDGYQMTWQRFREERIAAGKADPGRKFVATPDEEQLRDRIANLVVGKAEVLWKHRCELTDEQLIWYRAILFTKCHGKLETRAREFPSTYDEAFTATARCMFSAEVINFYTRTSSPPLQRGNLYRDKLTGEARFASEVTGRCRIWRQPIPGREYVIGADVGGEKKGQDPHAAYVLDKQSLEIAAAYRGLAEWEVYSDDLFMLGQLFNVAELVVENNRRPAVVGKLHSENYPRLYYYWDEQAIRGQRPRTPGFNTNRKTRPMLIDHVDSALRTHKLKSYDPGLPRELETFVWVEREKRYRATGKNNDDRIMALALAVYRARGYVDSAEDAPVEHSAAYTRFLQLQAMDDSGGERQGPIYL